MTGDSLQDVRAGQPLAISALAWNAHNAAARAHQNGVTLAANLAQAIRSQITIPIENGTGADLSRNSVLGLTSPIVDPSVDLDRFLERPAFVGVAPSVGTHEGIFGITVTPIKTGQVGRAVIAGVALVQIDMQAAAVDRVFAEIKNAITTELISGATGSALILWSEAGAGVKWAAVRLANLGGAGGGGGSGDFVNGTITAVNGLAIDLPANLTYDVLFSGAQTLLAAKPICRLLSEGGPGKLQSAIVGQSCVVNTGTAPVTLWQVPESLSDSSCVT